MKGTFASIHRSGSRRRLSLTDYITPREVIAAAVSSLRPAVDVALEMPPEMHQERHD